MEYSVFTKDYGILTKEIRLEDGEIVKDGSQCRMASGSVKIVSAINLLEFSEQLKGLQQNQAIGLSVTANEKEIAIRIKVKKALKDAPDPDAVARTKDYFTFKTQPTIMLLDYDPEKGKPSLSVDEVYVLLLQLVPELIGCEVLALGSTSSGLYREGEAPPEVSTGGIHFYIIVDDGNKILDLGKIILKRCWLMGLGRYDISKDGKLLPRTLFDEAVYSSERLIFEAAPVLGAGIKQLPRMVRYWGAAC